MWVVLQVIGFLIVLCGVLYTDTPMLYTLMMMMIGVALIVSNIRATPRSPVGYRRVRIPSFYRVIESIEQSLPRDLPIDHESIFRDFSISRHLRYDE